MRVVKERDVPIDVRVKKPLPPEPKVEAPAEDKVIAAIDRLISAVQALNTEDPPDQSIEPLHAIADQLETLSQRIAQPQPAPVVNLPAVGAGYRFTVHYDKLGNIEYVDAVRIME